MRVEWHIQHSLREVFEPAVLKYISLLPAWCRRLEIHELDGDDALGECRVSEPYRQAALLLAPRLAGCEAALVESVIRHEFVHVLLAPLVAVAERCVVVAPEDVREWAAACLEHAHEAVTEDIQEALK